MNTSDVVGLAWPVALVTWPATWLLLVVALVTQGEAHRVTSALTVQFCAVGCIVVPLVRTSVRLDAANGYHFDGTLGWYALLTDTVPFYVLTLGFFLALTAGPIWVVRRVRATNTAAD